VELKLHAFFNLTALAVDSPQYLIVEKKTGNKCEKRDEM
jgi:hypothetical protein